MNTISILGCGWLGRPLAERLLQRGHRVKGSTTSPEKLTALAEAGIAPYLLNLDPILLGDDVGDFFDADVLFLNIPPPRREPHVVAYHRRQIESLLTELRYASVRRVVMASSTSVYPDFDVVYENNVAYEKDARPTTPVSEALLAAERLLLADRHFDTTVLRFAGLYGYSRKPGRFLAGRKGLRNGGAPVNLVHRDDALGAVLAVLNRDTPQEIFNVCADEHPSRKTFYTHEAARLGLDPPEFADEEGATLKIVSNQKLKTRLGYTFLHPDPMQEAP